MLPRQQVIELNQYLTNCMEYHSVRFVVYSIRMKCLLMLIINHLSNLACAKRLSFNHYLSLERIVDLEKTINHNRRTRFSGPFNYHHVEATNVAKGE
jgi:hypothetical protein